MSHPIARMRLLRMYGASARALSNMRRMNARYGGRLLTVEEFWEELAMINRQKGR